MILYLHSQEKPIVFADSAKKECDLHNKSISVFTQKSVAIELHALPNYTVGHFSILTLQMCGQLACPYTLYHHHPTLSYSTITPLLNAVSRHLTSP